MTQRGNGRQFILANDNERRVYLDLLAEAVLRGITYGPVGLTNDTLGNSLAETFAYNNRNWLSTITSTPHNLGLTYVSNGSALTANDSVNGNWTYGYDSLSRLTSANKSGLCVNYVYDQYGNRTQQNVTCGSGPQPQFSFNAATNRISTTGYTYDAAGNLTWDGNCSYTWDGENRPLTSTCPVSGTTTYIYDAEGRRIAKAVGLPDVIAHGMFTMAEAGRFVTDWAGPGAVVLEFGVRFSAPVVVPDNDAGATISVSGQVTEKLDGNRVALALTARSADTKVLTRASAVVRLPSAAVTT